MSSLKKVLAYLETHSYFIYGPFFLILAIYSFEPIRDFDIWFHLKSGELFVNNFKIFHTDVFSYTEFGHEWIPHEWLAAVYFYLVNNIAPWTLPLTVSVMVFVLHYLFFLILRKILNINIWLSLLITFFYYVSTFEYFTARPHIFGYTLFLLTLYIVLLRFVKGKNYLWLTPLITLVWVNTHGSVFFAPGFPFAFGILAMFQWLVTKKKESLVLAKQLFLFGFINLAVTLTPPIGYLQYKQLWLFFVNLSFIRSFIAEWEPLSDSPFGFWIFTIEISIVVALTLFNLIARRKNLLGSIWLLPLLPIAFLGYSASRNAVIAQASVFIIFAWGVKGLYFELKKIKRPHLSRFFYLCLVVFFIALVIINSFILKSKRNENETQRLYFPVNAAAFIKSNLKGNMFNEYSYGGYLLYALYPEQKVFIDGRSDIYLSNIMRDYQLLSVNKNLPDDKYHAFLNSYWDKYNISFIVISPLKHNIMRKISRLMAGDPNWSLVFWDDDTQVLVKHDGKNDAVLAKYAVNYATPYDRNPWREGDEDKAIPEYVGMNLLVPSAHSLNAIGFDLLKKGQIEEAKNDFIKAIQLDPTFESPYMNLGEIAAHDGDINGALRLYIKAQNLAEDRGLTYERIGDLFLQRDNNPQEAIGVWQKGIRLTVDEDAKKRLQEKINQYTK